LTRHKTAEGLLGIGQLLPDVGKLELQPLNLGFQRARARVGK
jgi:hypothetical protein